MKRSRSNSGAICSRRVLPVDRLLRRSAASAPDIDVEIDRLAKESASADHPDVRADLCDQMVLCALPLADSIARRYGDRGIDRDDLTQVARLAVVKAVQRYRPGAGPGFTAYAVPTIYGEIKRFFRDQGWTVRPPRRLQELRVRVQSEEEQLRHLLRREPTDAEVADRAQCAVGEVSEARACSGAFHAISLDLPTGVGEPLGDQLTGTPCRADHIVVRDALRGALSALDERQRLVVRLRFAEDLTQTEIAARIGVSQMQVSRMLSRILATLRRELEPDPDAGPTGRTAEPVRTQRPTRPPGVPAPERPR